VRLSPDVEERETFHSRDTFIGVIDGGSLVIAEAGQEPEVMTLETGQGILPPEPPPHSIGVRRYR